MAHWLSAWHALPWAIRGAQAPWLQNACDAQSVSATQWVGQAALLPSQAKGAQTGFVPVSPAGMVVQEPS